MINPAKTRIISVLVLSALQFILAQLFPKVPYFPDFLFLIIIYNALRASFLRTQLVACLLGWLTDYLCGGVIGVFGFSRIVAASLVHEIIRFIDLKKKGFTFFLVLMSLALSNGIAQLFFYLIHSAPVSLSLLFWQPLTTAALALLLVYWHRMNNIWDVY